MSQRLDRMLVRRFILDHISDHPSDIAKLTASHFGVSRQTAHAHLRRLVESGEVSAKGHARHRKYEIAERQHHRRFDLLENRDEDRVWRQFVAPLLGGLKPNAVNLFYHGMTEMFNNAIDHSEGTSAIVNVRQSLLGAVLEIHDDGVGIFEKIRSKFHLIDHRHAILELSKGKLTTDPERHSGEGIFFTSRMFDEFSIISGHLYFVHSLDRGDWLIETRTRPSQGTSVIMKLRADTDRTVQQVYDAHIRETVEEEFSFSRTHVPLTLAVYGNEGLVSRSQARRVLARFDRFKEILLNFAGIEAIGQAFADEIFRVYKKLNPGVNILYVNATESIERMIQYVTRGGENSQGPKATE